MAQKRRKKSVRPAAEPSRHQKPGSPRTPAFGIRGVLAAVAIAAAGVWAYSNSFPGVFVLDDVRGIVLNPTIQSFSSALSPPQRSTVSGRPIANLSFAISYAMSGSDPRGFHAINLVIHLAAALAVLGIVRRILVAPPLRERFGQAALPLAFAVAVIWVVHPLTTSAVTYIVQRVESLMSLFYLLTLYCAIRATESRAPSWWTAVAIASCALGMATKEVMVTAPAAVALWMWTFGPRRFDGRLLMFGLAATWIVFGVLVFHEHRSPSIVTSPTTAWQYLLTQSQVLVRYLRLAIVPRPLVFLYTWPLATSMRQVAAPALGVLVLLAGSIAAILRRHPLGFAGGWFFLILAPTSSVIPIVTEVAAEHRMYLPLVPLIAVVVSLAYAVLGRIAPRMPARPSRIPDPGWLCAIAAVIVAAAASVETRGRNRDYASEETLWRDTVRKQPRNERAHVGYASALMAGGHAADAIAEFEAAAQIDPSDRIAQARLGHLYGLQRQDASAVQHLQRAHDLQPGDPVVTTELAGVLADSNDPLVRDPAKALPLAEEAVRLTSRRDAAALEVLAVAHAYLGHGGEALAAMQEAVDAARRTGDPRVMELEQRLAFYRSRIPAR